MIRGMHKESRATRKIGGEQSWKYHNRRWMCRIGREDGLWTAVDSRV